MLASFLSPLEYMTSLLRRLSVYLLCLLITACGTPPKREAAPQKLAPPQITTSDLNKPPHYIQTNWDNIPGWQKNPLLPGFTAWRNGCISLKNQNIWQSICKDAQNLAMDEHSVRRFIEKHFVPLQIQLNDGNQYGIVTGYYEPEIKGSRHPGPKALYPIYQRPEDLITVDLNTLYPEFKNKKLRGRLVNNKLIPYYSRTEIAEGKGKMQALAWAEDPIDAFFLQVQGSGRIRLTDGSIMRIGYADHNGHPYRSIGKWLIETGKINSSEASMQGIKKWIAAHPDQLQTLFNTNPSFVFFRELEESNMGPLGTMGVPLTATYSVAVDRNSIPLGAPLYLATEYPNEGKPLQRLVAAQDTGSAIQGPLRIDFFWGPGDKAGALAGKMKQPGRVWVLWPKGSRIQEAEFRVQ